MQVGVAVCQVIGAAYQSCLRHGLGLVSGQGCSHHWAPQQTTLQVRAFMHAAAQHVTIAPKVWLELLAVEIRAGMLSVQSNPADHACSKLTTALLSTDLKGPKPCSECTCFALQKSLVEMRVPRCSAQVAQNEPATRVDLCCC
jgi:hypothetical protein